MIQSAGKEQNGVQREGKKRGHSEGWHLSWVLKDAKKVVPKEGALGDPGNWQGSVCNSELGSFKICKEACVSADRQGE